MEDRYLFKAKRLDNGEWVEGYLIYAKKDCYVCENPYECMSEYSSLNGQSYGFGGFKLVDTSTICQCTGLKDKNGKLIWENDIVVYRDCTEEKYVIAWELNKCCFEYQQYSCSIMNFDELSGCEVEVLGNIFDNPELLESEG